MSTFAGGYAGQVLYVNLTDGSMQKKSLQRDFALKYIGGRGFSSRILGDELNAGTDPFSPENIVILAAGPLNDTPTPLASRLTVAAKSPLTGALGDANSGGYWAPELKYAGFDAIVLKGISPEPVYLWVEDGKAELRKARHLWGLGIHVLCQHLKEEIDDDSIHICAIGPGGENRVRYACVLTDGESAGGRCGIGAVMGAKRLKAVAVRGSCHLRGFPYIDEFIKPEEAEAFFGTAAISRLESLEGKGKMVAWSEDWVTLADLAGVCKFAWYRSRNFPMLIKRGLNLMNEILVAATGLPREPEGLLRCGERVYNVEKLFNLREGFGREADYPPQRFFQEETPDGPSKGARLNRSEYDRVLDDYYEARGWDKRTGQPTPQKLRSLGLE